MLDKRKGSPIEQPKGLKLPKMALVADLSVDQLRSIIKETNDDIRATLGQVASDVSDLKTDTQELKEKIQFLEKEREKDKKHINQLEEQLKRKNLLFKGLEAEKSLGNAVMSLCLQKLKISQPMEIVSTRKIYEKDGKMGVVAEFRSEDMIAEVFKNTKKLAGTSISIEADLNEEKREQKRVLLLLRKQLLSVSKTHKISVRNNKLRVGEKWFYWNKDLQLMYNQQNAGDVLKTLYNSGLEHINFKYNDLLEKINSKN